MLRRPILLLSAFFGLWLAITAKSAEVPAGTRSSTALVDHSAARVAVLLDEEVPRQGVPLDLPVPVMLRLLEREGIPAVTISPEDLADPERFNARRYSILVMTTGNCYPKAALTNLHTFRSSGGCLVTSSFAFYTVEEKVESESTDSTVRPRAFAHGPDGVGTGYYQMLKPNSNPPMKVPNNPLGFKCTKPHGDRERITWMDPASLSPGDELWPLLTIVDPKGVDRAAAALVRHKCKEFRGACDLWLGGFQSYNDITDRNVTEQLFCRGILWCLKEKGVLNNELYGKRMRILDERKPIPELPAKVTHTEEPRPWGDSFLPKSAIPARKLLVVNTGKLTEDERIALTCLQGLIAREQPQLWLIRSVRDKQDRFWLEQHKEAGVIDDWEEVADWKALFKQFKSVFRGAVVADPGIYRSDLLALNVAMCEDLILASPDLARQLDIPIKADLRRRFTTYAEGMRWVWATYKSKFNRFVCDFMYPKRLADCVFDYDLQWRAPVFWIAGTKDAREPGADASEEFSVIGTILAQMAPQSAVLGFPAQGELGAGEPIGVQLVSRYGRGLVCTNTLANMSVTSGVWLEQLTQPRQTPLMLDPNKIYVAMTLSDGDNLNCWEAGFFQQYFTHPGFGKVPLAFTMGPELRELTPLVARWFYDHAAPNTEFICGVSGITYTAPSDFGIGYIQPSTAQKGFLKWTAWAMKSMGMRTLNLTPGSRDSMETFSLGLPFCHSLVHGWTRESEAKLESLAYTMPGGMPGFDSAMLVRSSDQKERTKADPLVPAKDLVADLAAIGKTRRPLFLNMIVPNWTFNMSSLEYVGKNAPSDVVFVTPTQLSELYQQYAKTMKSSVKR
ncbi:MAG: GxGYxYP domain-containing protein [Verrucomicrobiota bacterium]